jgi:DNA polymerase-3 subunit chi
MTRVDFYVLEELAPEAVERFICRLVGRAWREGNEVFVQVADRPQAERIDDLLWTFQDISFVPHGICGETEGDPPVRIGLPGAAPHTADLLVNLGEEVPPRFAEFERVLELVPPEPARRDLARARYRYYQERGYPLNTHHITAAMARDTKR